jgi:hypothetical protein
MVLFGKPHNYCAGVSKNFYIEEEFSRKEELSRKAAQF